MPAGHMLWHGQAQALGVPRLFPYPEGLDLGQDKLQTFYESLRLGAEC